MALTADDFARFYRELYPERDGAKPREPFPWQQALVERVLREGWPDAIDIPTGLGKTSGLDVAVYCAAMDRDKAPRRLFFVVDRRLIVDAAWEHARHIADTLTRGEPGTVSHTIAQALHQDGDDGPVLSVTRLRGGITWDSTWLDRPDRFAIVTGTVDQIGSRMLFRGYGVTEYARPIDAALTSTDSLVLIDEAHISEPFRRTISDAAKFEARQSWWSPPTVVTMSATTSDTDQTVHRITGADHADPVAAQRLNAAKRLHLVEVAVPKAKAPAAMTDAMSHLAAQLVHAGAPVLVVANTVALARSVHTRLAETTGAAVQVELLTGRSRMPDRQLVTDRFMPLVNPARDRQTPQKPLIVVATQTVEVGIDIDVNTLVTQSAELPALVQRLGRLNRRGSLPDAARAIIVHDTATASDDPVYGPATQTTWEHLASQTMGPARYGRKFGLSDLGEGLDASPLALRAISDTAPDGAVSPKPLIPVLLPEIMDSWAKTSPTPVPDTPVEEFLHGIKTTRPPVTVVWRYGLDQQPTDEWADIVGQIPPVSGEGIDVPIAAVRAWLESEQDTADVSDLDGALEDELEPATSTTGSRIDDGYGHATVLRYGDNPEPIGHNRIRPGDTIVVPTTYGGCDIYGWHPASRTEVTDIADLTPRRDRNLLRLGDSLARLAASPHIPGDVREHIDILITAADELITGAKKAADVTAKIDRALTEIHRQLHHTPWRNSPFNDTIAGLVRAHTSFRTILFQPSTEDLTAETITPGPWTVLLTNTRAELLATDAETESTSVSGHRISLRSHQQAVADLAAQFATNLGLPIELVDAVKQSGAHHDEGKHDPRFQMMLAYHPDHPEPTPEPLAKSGLDTGDRAAFRLARRLSGYPQGARHEELSARIAGAYLTDHPLRDLIVHLVASHHGRARPILPAVPDPQLFDIPVDGIGHFANHEPVDVGHSDIFAALNQQYGRWGLALLETIVRLADQTVSRDNTDPIPLQVQDPKPQETL